MPPMDILCLSIFSLVLSFRSFSLFVPARWLKGQARLVRLPLCGVLRFFRPLIVGHFERALPTADISPPARSRLHLLR